MLGFRLDLTFIPDKDKDEHFQKHGKQLNPHLETLYIPVTK